MTDATSRVAQELVRMPQSDDLVADVRSYLLQIAVGAASPIGHALLLSSVRDVGDNDDERAAVRRVFWERRFAPAIERLEQARDEGHLRGDVDIPLLVESLVAPIHFRVLLRGEPVDGTFVDSLLAQHSWALEVRDPRRRDRPTRR